MSCHRERAATNTGSGPEFFGFSHPTIQNLIQHLPGAEKCSKYQWVDYDAPRVVKGSASHSFGSGVPSNASASSAAAKRGGGSAAAAKKGARPRMIHPAAPQQRGPGAWQGRGVYQQQPVPAVNNPSPAYYQPPVGSMAEQSESSSGSYSSSGESGSDSESDEDAEMSHIPQPAFAPQGSMPAHMQQQAMWGRRPNEYLPPGMARPQYMPISPGLVRHPMPGYMPGQMPVGGSGRMVAMPHDNQYGDSSGSGSESESGSESGSTGSESESDYDDAN